MPGTHYPNDLTRVTVRFLLQKAGFNVKRVRTSDMGYFLQDGSKITEPTFAVSAIRERGLRQFVTIDVYGLPDVPGDGTVGDNERVIAATDAQHAEALSPLVLALAEYGVKSHLLPRCIEVDLDQASIESEQEKVEQRPLDSPDLPDASHALPDGIARELRKALGAMPYAAPLNTKPETVGQMVDTLNGLARILAGVSQEQILLQRDYDALKRQRQAVRDFFGTSRAVIETETVTLAPGQA
jgi:hypothetical protein